MRYSHWLCVAAMPPWLSATGDSAIRSNLCDALLDHFSFECVEPARPLIKDQELTPDLRRLRSSLIAVCKIMETRFAEFDVLQEQAKKDAQEEWAKSQEIQKMAYETGGDIANRL